MARRGSAQPQNGCALLVLCLLAFVIGKCTGDSDDTASTTAETNSSTSSLEEKYVSTDTLNCRSDPSPKATITTKVSFGDTLGIEEEGGEWTRVRAAGGPCWVSSKFLSDTYPVRTEPEPQPDYQLPPPREEFEPAGAGFSCGSKRYCGQMNSCEEAEFYLNQCGLSRLDGDSDGVPCESICG